MSTLAMATAIGLIVTSAAHADVKMGINLQSAGQRLTIAGDGSGADLTFSTASSGLYSGLNVFISGVSNLPGDSLSAGPDPGSGFGLGGLIEGSFRFATPIDTLSDGSQRADLTSNSAKISFADGDGGEFSADIGDSFIRSTAAGGQAEINTELIVNLTNIDYTGTTIEDFVRFATAPEGESFFAFTLTDPKTLEDLIEDDSIVNTSFTGSLTAVPEPGPLALTALTALPMLGYYVRRRRRAA